MNNDFVRSRYRITWAMVVVMAILIGSLLVHGRGGSNELSDRKQIFSVEVSLKKAEFIDEFLDSLRTYADSRGFEIQITRVSSQEPKYSIGLRGFGYEIIGGNPFRYTDFSFGYFKVGEPKIDVERLKETFEQHLKRFEVNQKP